MTICVQVLFAQAVDPGYDDENIHINDDSFSLDFL
jgi:hypothetical protein